MQDSCICNLLLHNPVTLTFACLFFLDGSDMVVGTPPLGRAGCGFTAVGSRLFVFAGERKLPNQAVYGEEEFLFIHHLCNTAVHVEPGS